MIKAYKSYSIRIVKVCFLRQFALLDCFRTWTTQSIPKYPLAGFNWLHSKVWQGNESKVCSRTIGLTQLRNCLADGCVSIMCWVSCSLMFGAISLAQDIVAKFVAGKIQESQLAGHRNGLETGHFDQRLQMFFRRKKMKLGDCQTFNPSLIEEIWRGFGNIIERYFSPQNRCLPQLQICFNWLCSQVPLPCWVQQCQSQRSGCHLRT